jgi:hypothetical protein
LPYYLYLCLAAGIPGPPETLQIFDVSRDGMTLTWYPPEDDGGSQVTGYIVERKEVRADRWVRVNKVPVTMTRYRSTGLIEGLEYEHRVTAINARGTGKPSRPSKPIVAMDPIGKYILYKSHNLYANSSSEVIHIYEFYKMYCFGLTHNQTTDNRIQKYRKQNK